MRALRRVAGLARPCHRRPLPCLCAHERAVSQAVCCAPCHSPYHRAERRVALLQRRIVAIPAPYRGASPGRVAPVSRYNPAASLARTHCCTPLRAGRPCHGQSLSCRGQSRPCRCLSRPYRGRPSMHRSAISWHGAPVVSRYNALYRDSGWENGQ